MGANKEFAYTGIQTSKQRSYRQLKANDKPY